MVLHLSGTCVSHRDTPVPTEDTTSLQPSHSRLQVASLREDGRAHTIHKFVFEHIALEVFSVAHLFRKNVHLPFQCLGQLLGGCSIIGTVTRFLKDGTTES